MAAESDGMRLSELISAVPQLERPVILLESGSEDGRARLAWGAQHSYRLDWKDGDVGRLDWLAGLPLNARCYGFIAYELGIPPKAARRAPMVWQPLADFFEPEHEVVFCRSSGGVLESTEGAVDLVKQAVARRVSVGSANCDGAECVERSFTQREFESAVRRVKDYIAAGDVYQVNLSLAQVFETRASPWQTYLNVREINPSPWMGFADFGDWQLVSGSPELLVETRGSGSDQHIIRARPIAGTRKKTGDATLDAAMRAELRLDEKERAEHVMLVDLARNDLGRVAEYGSVRVSESEVVEEYSHVFHLVSQVEAVIKGITPSEVIAAVFPGGTITGVPKIRAMEVIAELEPVARGAYTGGLGWFGPEGMQLNILIRSAVVSEGRAVVQAGAGVVWDSVPEREWKESNRKAAAMLAALGVRP